jgi:hypothetical protein
VSGQDDQVVFLKWFLVLEVIQICIFVEPGPGRLERSILLERLQMCDDPSRLITLAGRAARHVDVPLPIAATPVLQDLPPGRWRLLVSMASRRFGGTGERARTLGRGREAVVELPARTAAIFGGTARHLGSS